MERQLAESSALICKVDNVARHDLLLEARGQRGNDDFVFARPDGSLTHPDLISQTFQHFMARKSTYPTSIPDTIDACHRSANVTPPTTSICHNSIGRPAPNVDNPPSSSVSQVRSAHDETNHRYTNDRPGNGSR